MKGISLPTCGNEPNLVQIYKSFSSLNPEIASPMINSDWPAP